MNYLQAIRAGIREEMRRDDRVMILGEDVGAKGGVFGVTEGLQKEFGEWRVLDSPLAESCIVGVAIGAALNGMRPIAEIQFQDFILPAVDQIISEAAKMRYRSNGDWGSAHGGALAVRRRRARCALSLAVHRGDLLPHPGTPRGGSQHAT